MSLPTNASELANTTATGPFTATSATAASVSPTDAAHFDDLGMHWVSEGVVILRRDDGNRATVRVDPVDADDVEEASEQVLRAFEARKRLPGLDRDALLDVPLSPTVALRLEQDLEPGDSGGSDVVEARIQLAEGTKHALETSSAALEIVTALDGQTPLGDVIAATADTLGLGERETTRLRREGLRLARDLHVGVVGPLDGLKPSALQGGRLAVILGARSTGQLRSNLGAADLVLEAEEVTRLDEVSDPGAADYPYGDVGGEQRSRDLSGTR